MIELFFGMLAAYLIIYISLHVRFEISFYIALLSFFSSGIISIAGDSTWAENFAIFSLFSLTCGLILSGLLFVYRSIRKTRNLDNAPLLGVLQPILVKIFHL